MNRLLPLQSKFKKANAAIGAVAAFVLGMSAVTNAQGPIAGKPDDGTPKPGIFVNGSLRWGRLVDVWAVDNSGNPVQITKKSGGSQIPDPLYLDNLVGESIGVSKSLATNPEPDVQLTLRRDSVSGAQILIIGAPFEKSAKSRFQVALKEVLATVGTIAIGGPSSLPPYSQVPRDAALAINFDRPVNPKTIGPETIQIFAGSSTTSGNLPPAPFLGRYVWKPENPKTVIFDPTINAVDDARIEENLVAYNNAPSKNPKFNPQVLPINSLGFPASISSTTFNVGIFIPSKYNINGGVTKILLGKDGTSLDINKSLTKYIYTPNGGALADGLTGVARVFRSGGASDANQGFTADPSAPQILGTQQIVITNLENFGANDSRIITFRFLNTNCNLSVRVGDSLQQGSQFATVSSIDQASLIDADINSYRVTVNYLQAQSFNLADPALLTTPYAPDLSAFTYCFIILQPQPGTITSPLTNVDPQTAFVVRFSKPMDVSKVNSLRNMVVLTNPALTNPSAANNFELVVGNVIPSPDLRSFKFVPYLPLPHTSGLTEQYKLMLIAGANGVTDLAGNAIPIPETSFAIPFTLRSNAVSNTSRFFNIRFTSLFEGAGPAQQVAGEVTKISATEISGRPVSHFSRDADRSNPFINAMTAFPQGIQTPLSSLGSRLQTVYRHIDLNLSINAITDIDLDVEGLSWAPFAGVLNVSDYFEHIRIDLAHSIFHPDEAISTASLLPLYPSTGLTTQSFAANIFEIASHPQQIVYEGPYSVSQNLLYTVGSGTVMMPWPKFSSTYTWRDTTYGSQKFGGPNGNGVNPDQYYVVLGLTVPTAGASSDKPYSAGNVPSVGLPLLMDFRIYPTGDPNTKGLNGFSVRIAVTSSPFPSFRVFSTGGLDTAQNQKTVVPDVAPDGTQPTGAYFPPGSTQGTPGTKTSNAGPEVYPGRADFAVKVSRVYTHYYKLDTATINSPTFKATNVLLLPTVQPANTSVTVAFRGATTVTGSALTDARCFDAYGNIYAAGATPPTIPPPVVTSGCGTITGQFPVTANTSNINFSSDISAMNSKAFLQMRFNFTSDIVNAVAARLNAFGIAYSNP